MAADNCNTRYDWPRIIGGYAVIGLVGSLAVVVGAVAFSTVRLEQKLVDTFGRLDPPPTLPPGTRAIPTRPTGPADGQPSRWAIVKKNDARRYGPTGKFLGRIPVGTVVGVCRIKQNVDGDLALCRVAGNAPDKDFYVRAHDLAIQSGPISQVTETEKALRVRKVQIEADIERRRGEELTLSPCYQEYVAALEAYKAFGEQVTALRAQRDSAQGADHMAISDELRKLKNDSVTLKMAHDQARDRLMAWRNQHSSGLSGDPTIRRLQDELAQVEDRIRRIEQGL